MTRVTRPVWRPPWYAWLLVGIVGLALAHRVGPHSLRDHWVVLIVLSAVGTFVLRALWQVRPAITMSAAIALTIFSGAWHQIGLGGLPLDRLLLVVVVLQLALRAPGAADVPPVRVRGVHVLMAIAICYVIVSAIASHTLTSETGFLTLFDQFGIAPYIVFLIAPSVFADQRDRNLLLGTLVALGLYLGFTAIFESLGPHALVFPRYILRVDEELPGHRAGGPFQSSVAEGLATVCCSVAALIAFTSWRSSWRYVAATAGIVSLFGCFLTLERGVWIGAAVGIVFAAAFTRGGRRSIVPGAIALAVIIGGVLVLSPTLAGKTESRVGDQESVWDRENQTSAGLLMVQAKPLFGFGWDRYTDDSLAYFRQAASYPMLGYELGGEEGEKMPLPLHDSYLSYAVEIGLLGLLLWAIVFFWGVGESIFRRAGRDLRPWKLGLIAIAVCFLVVGVFNPYQAPFPTMLVWAWAGVAIGACEARRVPSRIAAAWAAA